MKAGEVHKLSDDEIKVEATRLRRRIFDLRSQTVTEKIEDTSQFGKARKDLARVLTELNARQTARNPAAKTKAKTKTASPVAGTAKSPAKAPRKSQAAKAGGKS
jgi:ribosomal protein L29